VLVLLPCALFEKRDPLVEQRNVSAEFINHEGLNQSALVRLQQFKRANPPAKDPAYMDVSDENHGRLGQLCHRHVCDVEAAQIDFGWTANSRDDDHVILGGQLLKRLLHPVAQSGLVSRG
jgi:hypothetical protein